MLQNINILAGLPPVESGNVARDVKALLTHMQRLQRALELCLEQLDEATERMGRSNETAK